MPVKMDPEWKAKWVAALRSGKYKQGKGALRRGDAMCCLGVLCDLVDPDARMDVPGHAIMCHGLYGGRYVLPAGVMARVGLHVNPQVGDGHLTLAEHNDEGMGFSAIADIIEKEFWDEYRTSPVGQDIQVQ